MWKQRDPMIRLKQYLVERKLWDDSKQQTAEDKAQVEVAAAVKRAEEIAPPEKADFFNAMYADLPADLVKQRDTMRTSSIGQKPEQIESPVHAENQ